MKIVDAAGDLIRIMSTARHSGSRQGVDLQKNRRVHDKMRDPQTRVYGHAGTIHGTERLDVEVSASGEVVAVWFRCQMLPFKEHFVDGQRAESMRESSRYTPRLVAVEVIDG